MTFEPNAPASSTLVASTTTTSVAGKTTLSIILAVSACHLINDVMQSLLAAIYPILKTSYGLDYVQIGLLTLTFQCVASLLQPAIGIYTDRHPLPYSLPIGMASSLVGLIILGFAQSYLLLLVGSAFIGLGSAIFHPESSRVARLASGGRHGLAQSLFQVGGNAGSAIGPLLAAFIVLPRGQWSVSLFAVGSLVGIFILWRVGRWYAEHQRSNAGKAPASTALLFDKRTTMIALTVLTVLTLTKNAYMASLSSYYTFFLIDKFQVGVQDAQLLLFVFLGASALGVFLGGPIGDRFGAKFVIWFSILGVLPFTLALPYADLTWTVVLTILTGLIFSSAFSAIVVFAQELMPGRIGMIAGIFFGFAFGAGGIAAAALGALADTTSIEHVFWLCSFLPLAGLLTVFLPDMGKIR
ncbi:MFS transporter [Devosia sp. RR2S18]|uniref:MFS transporter n=1 Tax=Devosia rhizosphaerae TaxID=3049774 RepID=UPI00253F7114|nr:MFS transporter [Devosia sp. RR2S18]WIJ26985.1 MFS transporter [Devosia sp. RR2S18]